MSLSLTLMNIVVIIIASIIMFRLKETLPIEKSIFWSDLGVARKIYHNVAFVPVFDQAPDDQEIQKRVTRFFPRASAMVSQRNLSWNKDTRNLSDTFTGSSLLKDSASSNCGSPKDSPSLFSNSGELLPSISERSYDAAA